MLVAQPSRAAARGSERSPGVESLTCARAGPHAFRVGELFFFVATILLTFLIYVLVNGAGMAKALKLFAYAAGATGSFALICLPILLLGRVSWYTHIVFYFTLFSLPGAITLVDFDRAVPRISLLGVVLINVLAIHFAESSSWITWLLNPFRLDGVFTHLIGLWPSCIALLLAVAGPPGDPRLRLVVGAWTQAVGLIWLLPIAREALVRFDATDWTSYLLSVVACGAAVHVALLAHSLVAAMKGKLLSTSRGSVSATRVIAERVYLTKYHPLLLAGLAVLWWFAVDAWQASPLLANSKIGIAYIVAAILGTLLMPERKREPDDLGAEIADARMFKWRSYRGTIFLFLFGFALFWLITMMNQDSVFIFGTHWLANFVLVTSILAGIFVLNGLFAGAWIIGDVLERPASGKVRRNTWIVALAIVLAWQYAILPRAHPQGGLDGNEQAFAHGRVYLWYATEVGRWYGNGRVVYFEETGGPRRRVCGDAGSPVDSFQVIMDEGIECRQGTEVRLVDKHGDPASGQRLETRVVPVQEIDASESACWPFMADVPTLSCREVVGALGDERRIPGMRVPSSWDIDAARYFQYQRDGMTLTQCIEIPADAALPDGAAGDATVLVFYRYAVESRPFWLLDREGSCARVHGSRDPYDGSLYYEWHPLIVPYTGQTKSKLF